MFVNQFFVKPLSGFIAFDPATDRPARAPAGPAPEASPAHDDSAAIGWAGHVQARPTWQAPAGSSVAKVEMAMLASVCAYFAFGLGSTLGLY